MDNVFTMILVTIVILVVVFLILREVNCWYWKINERISLMEEQNRLLEKLTNKSLDDNSNSNIQTISPTNSVEKVNQEVDKLADMIKEAKETKLKNKDFLRGKIMTLSIIPSDDIIALYKAKYGIDLFEDIKTIDAENSKINYVIQPFIDKGKVLKK